MTFLSKEKQEQYEEAVKKAQTLDQLGILRHDLNILHQMRDLIEESISNQLKQIQAFRREHKV